jgi:O-antigen/teichoic acid export membrane protein
VPARPSDLAEPPAAGVRLVLRNLVRLIGGKAGAGLLSLVYLVLAAHRLGARDYGVLVLVNSYVLLVGGVVAFSGFHGVVRHGAQALAARDPHGLARVVRLMTALELGCGLLAVLVAATGAPLVGPRLGWPPGATRLAVPYALAVVATVRQTPQGLLQLAGRFDLIAAHSLVSPLVRLAGAVGLWLGGGTLDGFILVWLASAVCEGLAMWLLAWPSWRKLAPDEPLLGRWRGRAGAPPGFRRFVLVTNLDLTLRELVPNLAPLTVGWLLGPAAAGLLAVAQRATNALQQPGLLLSQASYAVLAGEAARDDLGAMRQTVRRSTGLALAAGLVMAGVLAVFARPVLLLVGGPGFAAATGLLILMAAARALALGAVPPTAGLVALGLPGYSAATGLVANLAIYPLLPLLIGCCGVAGAGWHALLQGLLSLAMPVILFRHVAGRTRDPRRVACAGS